MRRGILGGTFDPPHLAHLVAGETAFRQLGLEVVTFLPTGSPWQKADRGVTAAEHRWEMTRRAVRGVAYFEADDREVRREGWTYTVDTLATFPEGETIFLLLGADSAAGLPTWKSWEEVVDRVEISVAPRPGTRREEVERAVPTRVHWLEMPSLPLSGTLLRERAAAGRSIRFLVPEPVWSYATEHHLYG